MVTATDEADLARRMERAELENAEIDGDVEGESEDDDEGLKFDEEGNAASSEDEEAKNWEGESSLHKMPPFNTQTNGPQ